MSTLGPLQFTVTAINGGHLAVQGRPKTGFCASCKAHPENPSENTCDGLFSSCACYMLHGMLVIIHIVLVVFYARHWEHRVTFSFTPTNNDFWPVVLSASLQAFYTIYTALLLFLTQRLAISRTLVRRLKLTAIHDISGAWAGLGSALSSVWRQTDIPASWWTTFSVTAYLASISVLHVTSSTLLQFQTFNDSMTTSVSTTLGWSNNLSCTNWGSISASLPVVNQLPGLVSAGISNTTLYDTPKTNSVVGSATVNATTITSYCGLLPNVTYYSNMSVASVSFSMYGGNYSLMMNASLPWSDQIQVLQWFEIAGGTETPSSVPGFAPLITLPDVNVLLMISTLLEIEPSVQDEVAVNMTWQYSQYPNHPNLTYVPYDIQVYFVQCSLSANTTNGLLDMQTNNLLNPMPISQLSTQWEMYQWTNITEGNNTSTSSWQTLINNILSNSLGSGMVFKDATLQGTEPSIAAEYIMSLVGLNLTNEYLQTDGLSPSPPISNFTLRLDELELAVAKAAAQLIWIAGQIGTSNGGLQLGNGTAYVDEEFIALRLNINLLPLSFAASASVVMLGLALLMTGAFDASHDSQAAIPDIGVLQLLWLGHRSASINEVLEDVEHPTEANLRRAGMIDVCFGKTVSDEEEFGSSTASDSLSHEADHLRDDEM